MDPIQMIHQQNQTELLCSIVSLFKSGQMK
jgi:hypothetical protein